MTNLKFAIRQLLKNPGFAAVAVLTLALGIGVNTSMFSGLHGLLLPELEYPESERLVRVFYTSPHSQRWPHSPANFLDQREQAGVFEAMAATTFRSYNLSEPGQPAEQLRAVLATAELIPMLGIQPQLGRAFLPEEDQPGRNNVVILNHTFWLDRFAADPNILGRPLRLDGETVTVIGVMPAHFRDRQQWGTVDLLRPMGFTAEQRQARGNNYLDVFARLKPGVSLAQGNAALETLAARLRQEHPDSNAGSGFRLVSLAKSRMDPRGQIMLWLIMGLAGFVLLIACANLANLQFARTAMRSRELAIRGALGARRSRLLFQLLTESLLLAALGGLLGLVLAHWANLWITRELTEDGRPLVALEIGLHVFGFALLATTFSGLAFGLVPAWLASRMDLNTALKQGARGTGNDRSQHRLGHSLIVAQVALALMLLAGAGLVISGLRSFGVRDPGWRIDGLHAGYLTLPAGKYPDGETRSAFVARLQEKLASLPGVEQAAIASSLPISSFRSHTGLTVEGEPEFGQPRLRSLSFVSPNYFATLGIRLVEGREFTEADTVGRPEVVIVNEATARAYWPNDSAVGKRIGTSGAWQEIVGVVGDVQAATDAGEPATRFQSYRPLAQDSQGGLVVAVRGAVTADTLRRAVAELDPDLPLSEAGSVRTVVGRFLDQVAVAGWLLGAFAGLGLFLAALGTYGVIAGYVGQRTNEIGLRMALGARIADVLWLVLGRGLRLTAVGLGLGLVGSIGLSRVLVSLAPGLKSNGPAVLFIVSGLLLLVAFIACWLPARRASRVNPMLALRSE
jgi:putative ABC transport system permease protein